MRLCDNYKITMNPHIVTEEHSLPTIEELFASMAGGQKFTKIDLTKAYLQLEVYPDDRESLTHRHRISTYEIDVWNSIRTGEIAARN